MEREGAEPVVLQPVETGYGDALETDWLLISAARAITLKMLNQREAAQPHAPTLIRAAEPFPLREAQAVADPALDLVHPMKGPFKAGALEWESEARAAMELARIAGILPAFMVDPEGVGEAVTFSAADLEAWAAPERLEIAARARLPVAAEEDSTIAVFRKPDDMREHAALIVGRQMADTVPLVRLHSECLTGDILGSLICD